MIRFLINAAIYLGAAAVGLVVAALVLDDFTVDVGPFIVVVAIFAALQGVLAPFITRTAHRNAPALVGGAGLITTFVALVLTDVISDGLTIRGVGTWIVATLIVWIATMIASLLLPVFFVKKAVDERRDR